MSLFRATAARFLQCEVLYSPSNCFEIKGAIEAIEYDLRYCGLGGVAPPCWRVQLPTLEIQGWRDHRVALSLAGLIAAIEDKQRGIKDQAFYPDELHFKASIKAAIVNHAPLYLMQWENGEAGRYELDPGSLTPTKGLKRELDQVYWGRI